MRARHPAPRLRVRRAGKKLPVRSGCRRVRCGWRRRAGESGACPSCSPAPSRQCALDAPRVERNGRAMSDTPPFIVFAPDVPEEEGHPLLQFGGPGRDPAGGDPAGSFDLLDHSGGLENVTRRGAEAAQRRGARGGGAAVGGHPAHAPQGAQLGLADCRHAGEPGCADAAYCAGPACRRVAAAALGRSQPGGRRCAEAAGGCVHGGDRRRRLLLRERVLPPRGTAGVLAGAGLFL